MTNISDRRNTTIATRILAQRQWRKSSERLLADVARQDYDGFDAFSEYICAVRVQGKKLYFCDLAPQQTSVPGRMIGNDKSLLHKVLSCIGIPQPRAQVFTRHQADQAWQFACRQQGSVALKPANASRNIGVTAYSHSHDPDEFRAAWAHLAPKSKQILVQQQIRLSSYYLLFCMGKLLCVLRPETDTAAAYPDTIAHNFVEVSTQTCHHFQPVISRLLARFPACGLLMLSLCVDNIEQAPDQQLWYIEDIHTAPYLHYYLPEQRVRELYHQIIALAAAQIPAHPGENALHEYIAPVWQGKAEYHRHDYASNREVMYLAALAKGLGYGEISNDLWYLQQREQKRIYFYKNVPDGASHVARVLTTVKPFTRRILQQAGINTPQGQVFDLSAVDEACAYARQLGYPVVVKPNAGSGGKGVTTHIQDEANLKAAILHQNSQKFIVEQHIPGHECRVVVAHGVFLGAMLRHAGNVVGDGQHTLRELMQIKTRQRKKIPHLSKSEVQLSPFVAQELQQQGIDENSIIPEGKKIYVHNVSNAGLGGDTQDISEAIHEGFRRIALEVLEAFPGLHYCGMDIQASDFTLAPDKQQWAILEVNENPDFAIHYFPWQGKPRDMARALLDTLFADKADREAPCTAVTLRIYGKVQGVFFRKWLARQAYLHALQGWVRNCSDGSVESVLQGNPGAVERVVKKCYRGPSKARVTHIVRNETAVQGFADFIITKSASCV